MPGAHRGSGTGSAGGGTHARSRMPWAVIVAVVLVLLACGVAATMVGLRSSPVTGPPAALDAPAPTAPPPGTAAGPVPLQARLDEITAASPLLFEGDRTELPPVDVATLTRLADALRADPAPMVVLTGHTAPVDGDPARCQQISQARADSVARWLTAAGIAPDRLRTVGMSHSMSEHGETWPQSRRVELRTL